MPCFWWSSMAWAAMPKERVPPRRRSPRLLEAFWQTPHPIFDPLGFLHLSLGRAHEEVVKLGVGLERRGAPARNLRGVLGAGCRRLLGARRRQPRLSAAASSGVGAHPRSQSRRGAAARGPDHRGGGAWPPDAQLRRMLPRRRRGVARDEHLDAPASQRPATCCCCAPMDCGPTCRMRISCASRKRRANRCEMP